MTKNRKFILFSLVLLTIAGVFLFSSSPVWARDPIDIDLGMDLNALIADHVNDLAGRRVVTFVPYSVAANTTESNTNNTGTNSQTNGQVAGISTIANVAGVSTGTAGSLALSAALSLLIALSYMAYTQTGLFKRREALSIIQQHRSDKNRFNFAS